MAAAGGCPALLDARHRAAWRCAIRACGLCPARGRLRRASLRTGRARRGGGRTPRRCGLPTLPRPSAGARTPSRLRAMPRPRRSPRPTRRRTRGDSLPRQRRLSRLPRAREPQPSRLGGLAPSACGAPLQQLSRSPCPGARSSPDPDESRGGALRAGGFRDGALRRLPSRGRGPPRPAFPPSRARGAAGLLRLPSSPRPRLRWPGTAKYGLHRLPCRAGRPLDP